MPEESASSAWIVSYAGTPRERLRLVKTIVSMANTGGGSIRVQPAPSARRELEAAAVEALVNRFVAPPLQGIGCEPLEDGAQQITVPDSERKPHVFTESGRFHEDGRSELEFAKGQLWVRRGSANAEAGADDVQRIVLEAAGRFLERIGAQMQSPGFVLQEEGEPARAVRLVDDPTAPIVRADPDLVRPLTRQELCARFERPYAWIAAALRRLGVESDRSLAYADRNSAGHPTRWRYTESVAQRIRARLDEKPDWDPIHEE
jgi:hypothetical protein